jgi:hypothetical protein
MLALIFRGYERNPATERSLYAAETFDFLAHVILEWPCPFGMSLQPQVVLRPLSDSSPRGHFTPLSRRSGSRKFFQPCH